MKKGHSKTFSAATIAFLVSWNCHAHVYSPVTVGSYFVKASDVTYVEELGWSVGHPPFYFGLHEYGYSEDAAGKIINPRTRVYIGSATFTMPLRRSAVAVSGGFILVLVLILADSGLIFLSRRRHKKQAA